VPTPPKSPTVIKKIKNWSFSSWQTYVKCPFKAYCKIILKLKEPSSPALDNGNIRHAQAEAFVSAKVPEQGWNEAPRSKAYTAMLTKAAKGTLPEELQTFAEEFAAIRLAKYVTEQSWAFRCDWSITRNDDWDGCWLRVKCDAHKVRERHGIFIDYKTGKKYPEKHDDALELYALAMFLIYPQLLTITAALWYVDLGEETVRDFKRSETESLRKRWEKDTFKMLNDTRFTPKPSNFECRYCHFSKEKGGPCKH
jgi:RecB family exonuclease